MLPAVITKAEMKTPDTPKNMIVRKFWKNCFFLT